MKKVARKRSTKKARKVLRISPALLREREARARERDELWTVINEQSGEIQVLNGERERLVERCHKLLSEERAYYASLLAKYYQLGGKDEMRLGNHGPLAWRASDYALMRMFQGLLRKRWAKNPGSVYDDETAPT
jgi:hypothetical protein